MGDDVCMGKILLCCIDDMRIAVGYVHGTIYGKGTRVYPWVPSGHTASSSLRQSLLMSYDGHVYCLDATQVKPYGHSIVRRRSETPTNFGHFMYIAVCRQQSLPGTTEPHASLPYVGEQTYCLDVQNGLFLWSISGEFAGQAPISDGIMIAKMTTTGVPMLWQRQQTSQLQRRFQDSRWNSHGLLYSYGYVQLSRTPAFTDSYMDAWMITSINRNRFATIAN
jgi:hypothetical protein